MTRSARRPAATNLLICHGGASPEPLPRSIAQLAPAYTLVRATRPTPGGAAAPTGQRALHTPQTGVGPVALLSDSYPRQSRVQARHRFRAGPLGQRGHSAGAFLRRRGIERVGGDGPFV